MASPILDPVERWIFQSTWRTLDEHAITPIPAAAELPEAADDLRRARAELICGVDRLRTLLLNATDLDGTNTSRAVIGPLTRILALAQHYEEARTAVDALMDDEDRVEYADEHEHCEPPRRYVKPGDTVRVVLSHTEHCREHGLAGRVVWVQLTHNEADIEPDSLPDDYAGPLRIPHADAGIYRDSAQDTLYAL